jgi:small glutamine-rich tetratricopeptide repeat-containing protein alpha
VDPNNANLKTNLENAKARLPAIDRSTSPTGGAGGAGGMPDLSALAGMFGGGGAGRGGGGGMPDLASLMQNPQLMQMAQNMMADGGLERMMQNPAVRNIVRACALRT